MSIINYFKSKMSVNKVVDAERAGIEYYQRQALNGENAKKILLNLGLYSPADPQQWIYDQFNNKIKTLKTFLMTTLEFNENGHASINENYIPLIINYAQKLKLNIYPYDNIDYSDISSGVKIFKIIAFDPFNDKGNIPILEKDFSFIRVENKDGNLIPTIKVN